MANPMIKYRVRDYMSIPDGDERRYELIDGELMLAPAPVPTHQMVVLELATILKEFVERHRLGRVFISPIDVVLSEHDVLQPDILFISTERLHIVGERNLQGAPDLVIEVLSPSTTNRDRVLKSSRYLRFGVPEYWIVDPVEWTIEVMRAGQTEFDTLRVYTEGTFAESPTFPGLLIDVSRIFAIT